MDGRRAVLRGSDKEVVVKVLKPGVEDVLTTDLSFLYLTSRVLEFLNPELERTSLAGIIGDIRASMLDEARGSRARVAGVLQRFTGSAANLCAAFAQVAVRRACVGATGQTRRLGPGKGAARCRASDRHTPAASSSGGANVGARWSGSMLWSG
jgi:hypothetical protein